MSFLDRFLGRKTTDSERQISELRDQLTIAKAEAEAFKAQREMPPEVEAIEHIMPGAWGLRQIVPEDMTMPGVGYGYAMSPYATSIQLMWGIERPPDYDKFRKLYMTVPIYHRAADEMVNLSVMKPYVFTYPDQKRKMVYGKFGVTEDDTARKEQVDKLLDLVRQKVCELDERIRLKTHLAAFGTDLIVLGNAFFENTFDESRYEDTYASYSTLNGTHEVLNYYNRIEKRDMREEDLWYWHTTEAEEVDADGKPDAGMRRGYDDMLKRKGSPFAQVDRVAAKRIVNTRRLNGVRGLDPEYIRVRRDAYGLVHGYIQILAFPPVALNTDQVVHARWFPHTWGRESTYGNSHFQAGIRNQEMCWQIENDMLIYAHNLVRFPGKFVNGASPDKSIPAMTEKKFAETWAAIKARKVSCDIAIDGNADFQPFTMAQGAGAPVLDFYRFIREDRTVNGGVPPVVLGLTETAGSGSETNKRVENNNFVVRLKTIQSVVGTTLIENTFAVGVEQEVKCDIDDNRPWGTEVKALMDALGLDCMTDIKKGGTITRIWEFPLWLMPDMEWEEIGREDKDRLVQRGAAMLGTGAFTINEVRQEMGYSDLAEDAGAEGDQVKAAVPAGIGDGGGFPKFTDADKDQTPADRENEKAARLESARKDHEGEAVAAAFHRRVLDDLADIFPKGGK